MTLRILLVEDDDDDAELLTWSLRRQPLPYSLERVKDVDACLAACAASEFDVLLLDLGLPGSSGFGALEQIVGFPGTPPIVVLTGLDDPAAADRAIAAGAKAYLIKSMDAEETFRAIRAAVVT
jgi:CheY-like chemotaxis protein